MEKKLLWLTLAKNQTHFLIKNWLDMKNAGALKLMWQVLMRSSKSRFGFIVGLVTNPCDVPNPNR